MARTDVTGSGSEPKSLSELAGWCRASQENRTALYAFLTTNEAIPQNTRKWGAWYKSIAHRIVEGISAYKV